MGLQYRNFKHPNCAVFASSGVAGVPGFLQKQRIRFSQPSQTSAADEPKGHTDASGVAILLRLNVYSNAFK